MDWAESIWLAHPKTAWLQPRGRRRRGSASSPSSSPRRSIRSVCWTHLKTSARIPTLTQTRTNRGQDVKTVRVQPRGAEDIERERRIMTAVKLQARRTEFNLYQLRQSDNSHLPGIASTAATPPPRSSSSSPFRKRPSSLTIPIGLFLSRGGATVCASLCGSQTLLQRRRAPSDAGRVDRVS